MRLDKLLANIGYGSRKEVKKLLKDKCVTVNGKVITDGKTAVDPVADTIYFMDEEIYYREFIYLMLNKPQGVISATEDTMHKTVIDLLDPKYHPFQLFPVGRLDKDTEGLLLLTNDGKLAHKLLSPNKEVAKTYFAVVKGEVTERDVEAFRVGVELDDGYKTKKSDLKIVKSGDYSDIELTITEGKFHQVKRMFEAVNKKVVYLKRISMGSLKLDEELSLGEYRELTEAEQESLKIATN